MRRYYITFRTLLIISIIDFAVAAPVPIQQKPQAGVYAVHTTKDARTKLRKRGDWLDELSIIFDNPESHSHTRPEPPAVRPSSSLQPSGPTDVSTNVEQPVPSISKEPPQLASSGLAPPNPGDDNLNKFHQLFDPYGFRSADEPSAAHPSSGWPPTHGWINFEQPVPSIPKEQPQLAILGHAPPYPGDDNLEKFNQWRDLHGLRFSDKSSAAPPSWGSPPSAPSHGWMDVEQPVSPFIPKELPQVADPEHAPTNPGDVGFLNNFKLWLGLHGHRYIDEPPVAPSSWGSPPSWPAPGLINFEKPKPSIPKKPSQVASTSHAPPIPGDGDLINRWPPPWTSQPSGPSHGWTVTDVNQPLSFTPKELPPVSSLDDAPPSPASSTMSSREPKIDGSACSAKPRDVDRV